MLTYSCSEQWDLMKRNSDGRFCDKCQHSVVDFSNWDRAAVVAYKREHPDACGLYRAEHIEPDLIPLRELLTPKRSILIAGLTFGTIQVSAQAGPPSTEQMAPIPGDGSTIEESVPVPSEKPDAINGTCIREVRTVPPRAKRWKRIYISKRFPFVHRRRYRVVGMAAF